MGVVGPDVVVVGSINVDLSVLVDRFGQPGETVAGHGLVQGGGGKGANQAVAAARLGRRVVMVGAVGQDSFGNQAVGGLEVDGIDVSHIDITTKVETGLALIEVSPEGENRIVVIAGANACVTAQRLEAVEKILANAKVILTQFEIPIATVEALVKRPRQGILIVNPAPAYPDVDLGGADLVVPNRSELAILTGSKPTELDHAAIDELVDRCMAMSGSPTGVVVTLGAEGALVVHAGQPGSGPSVTLVPAVPVEPVDTTAAGDAFCGALADALSRCDGAFSSSELVEAARWAGSVAAVTVTRRGAQASLPRLGELDGVRS